MLSTLVSAYWRCPCLGHMSYTHGDIQFCNDSCNCHDTEYIFSRAIHQGSRLARRVGVHDVHLHAHVVAGRSLVPRALLALGPPDELREATPVHEPPQPEATQGEQVEHPHHRLPEKGAAERERRGVRERDCVGARWRARAGGNGYEVVGGWKVEEANPM